MLTGKKCLITGATGDIGSAMCQVFAKNNAELFITGTKLEALQQTTENIISYTKNYNHKAVKINYYKCDLSNKVEIMELVKQANAVMGGIDVLVCNAGITDDSLMIKMKDEQWQNVLDINLTANFLLMRECLKVMIKQKSGKIINISSMVGLTGNVGQANYSASKAGLIALTKTIALEYASKGITANCIAPGFIDTAMTKKLSNDVKQNIVENIPLKSYGKPIDVANTALFLASSLSNYITGETINVNGGLFME